MKKGLLFSLIALLGLSAVSVNAQNNVGIGTNTPDPWALVDMVTTNKGLLIPRLDSNARKAIPLAAIRNGLLVYDKDYDCFFYYSVTATGWVSLCNALGPIGPTGATGPTGPTGPAGSTGATAPATCNVATDLTLGSPGNTSGLVSVTDSCGTVTGTNAAWITTGNFNTSAGTNYIGTNDNADFVFKTGGSFASNERMRIMSGGQVVVNKNSPATGHVFSAYATSSTSALGDTAVYGLSTATGGKGVGVLGVTTTGNGVQGRSSTGKGVYGLSTVGGIGVYGISNSGGTGVYGTNSGNGIAVDAQNTGTGDAIHAVSSGGTSHGILAMSGGSGIGTWALQNGNANGVGVAGEGGGLTTTWLTGVSTGGVFNGKTYGVYGYAYSGSAAIRTAGGYFRDSISAALDFNAYVATYGGGVNNKILGTGAVSTIVEDTQGDEVILFAPEAPEVLFEDYGQGQLVNGEAQIQLDDIFSKNVTIDAEHPLRVLVQLEGDCNGVYVTDKSETGFTVKELNGGNSNVKFTYHVVANRANSYKNGQLVSKYADVRFPKFEGFPKNAYGLKYEKGANGESQTRVIRGE